MKLSTNSSRDVDPVSMQPVSSALVGISSGVISITVDYSSHSPQGFVTRFSQTEYSARVNSNFRREAFCSLSKAFEGKCEGNGISRRMGSIKDG